MLAPLNYCDYGRKITCYLFHRQRKEHSMPLVRHLMPVFNIYHTSYSVYINYPFRVSYSFLYEYLINLIT